MITVRTDNPPLQSGPSITGIPPITEITLLNHRNPFLNHCNPRHGLTPARKAVCLTVVISFANDRR